MTWPVDPAFEKLIEAILTFTEIHGDEATRNILQQEASRKAVVLRHRPVSKALVPAPARDAAESVDPDIAVAALEAYADPKHYTGGQKSWIAKDKGQRARDALKAIVRGENGNEGGE